MDFPELDGNQKIALAALALAALAALLFLTAQAGPQDGAQNATQTKLLQTEIIANPPLVLRYGPNESAELLEITNNGTNPSDFDLYSIVPSERASAYSLVSVDNKPPSPGESAFLSDRVAFRDSMLLAPNGVKTKSFGFQKSGGSPLYLITKPAAAANDTEKFKSLLRKIADLGLTRGESGALQKRLNDVLAAANFSTELLDSLDAFVDAVKNATETRITNPDYNATDDISRLPMPTPRPANFTNPLDGLPASINLTVSELEPFASSELSFDSVEALEIVTKTEGGVERYAEDVSFERLGQAYHGLFSVDLAKAPKNADGMFKTTSYSGTLTVGLSRLVLSKEISVEVKVKHSRAADLQKKEELVAELESAAPETGPIVSASLAGKKIVVDAGHGCASGAKCGGVREADRNAVVARKLEALLQAAGVETKGVYSTCTDEIEPEERTQLANAWPADLLVSIHHDSCATGVELVYYPNNPGWKQDEAKRVGALIDSQLKPLVGSSRGLVPDDASNFDQLFISDLNMPGILVEVTRTDAPQYSDPTFVDKAAKAIFDGIAEYYGYNAISEGAFRPSERCSKSVITTPPYFSACGKYESLLKQYMQTNGLYDLGLDLGMVESLITQESSCNSNIDKWGLMQVKACADKGGCVSVEENINLGTAELRDRIEQVSGLLPQDRQGDALTLALFGYNRGEGTVELAIDKIKTGMATYDAMLAACKEKYNGGADCSGYDQNACCSGTGLGARYPERIFQRYQSACTSAGGQPIVS